jgi:uncharacterized Zn finger protein
VTTSGVPFANILHQEVIRQLAGSASFERGQRYFEERRVVALARREGTLTANVRGADTYRVQIWVHHDALAYSCSCPQGQDKAFCKHAVATALAWLADRAEGAEAPGPPMIGDGAVASALASRSRDELVALLVLAARSNEDLRKLILAG